MYFDVPEDDLNELTVNQIKLEGEARTEFTGQYLRENYRDVYRGGGGSALNLVVGQLVRNPHEVGNEEEASRMFEDDRKQYAFRKDAENFLLKDPAKMGAVLFDV